MNISEVQMLCSEVQMLCSEGKIIWTEHVEKRMMQRNITRKDVKSCIQNGEIIEDYPDDYPFPSCLIFGSIESGRILHVVVSINDGISKILNIITVYVPNDTVFEEDMKTRRRK